MTTTTFVNPRNGRTYVSDVRHPFVAIRHGRILGRSSDAKRLAARVGGGDAVQVFFDYAPGTGTLVGTVADVGRWAS